MKRGLIGGERPEIRAYPLRAADRNDDLRMDPFSTCI